MEKTHRKETLSISECNGQREMDIKNTKSVYQYEEGGKRLETVA